MTGFSRDRRFIEHLVVISNRQRKRVQTDGDAECLLRVDASYYHSATSVALAQEIGCRATEAPMLTGSTSNMASEKVEKEREI